MKKLFLVSVSVLCLLLFSATAKAETITIDFDELTAGDTLLNQYASDGIFFSDGQSNSPATVATFDGSNRLMPNDSDDPFYIDLTTDVYSFSCDKWEPDSNEGSSTVYWNFYSGTNLLGSVENSLKNAWSNVSFDSNQAITKIKIWGNTDESAPYYLDNLSFSKSMAVPEPLSLFLLGFGLIGLVATGRKLKK